MGRSKQTTRPEVVAAGAGKVAPAPSAAAKAKVKAVAAPAVPEAAAGEAPKKHPVYIVVRKDAIINKTAEIAKHNGVKTAPDTQRLTAECIKKLSSDLAEIAAMMPKDGQMLTIRHAKSSATIYARKRNIDLSEQGPLGALFAAADRAVQVYKTGPADA
jgi:hypothetical protein